jgi:hypothetical protein
MLPKSYKEENKFETVMELYEAGSPNLKLYRVMYIHKEPQRYYLNQSINSR